MKSSKRGVSIYSCPNCGKLLYWEMDMSHGYENYHCHSCDLRFDDYEIEPQFKEPFKIVPIVLDEDTDTDTENKGEDTACDLILFEEESSEVIEEGENPIDQENQLRKCETCGFYSCRCEQKKQKIPFITKLKTTMQYYFSLFLKKAGSVFLGAAMYLREKGNNQYDKSISNNPKLSEKLFNKKVKNIEIITGGSL